MNPSLLEFHLPDGALVRYLDGASAAAERGRTDEHLAVCPRCSGRLKALGRRSARLSELLAAGEPEIPEFIAPDATVPNVARARPRPRRITFASWPRAAAAAALLLATGGLAASPVGAWMMEWMTSAWHPATPSPSAPSADAVAPSQPHTRVQFTPETEELKLALASRQVAGVLTVATHDGTDVTVEVARGRGGTVLVLPDGVQIGNHPLSDAEYRVRVPARLRRVEIQIGREAPVTVVPAEIEPGGERVVGVARPVVR